MHVFKLIVFPQCIDQAFHNVVNGENSTRAISEKLVTILCIACGHCLLYSQQVVMIGSRGIIVWSLRGFQVAILIHVPRSWCGGKMWSVRSDVQEERSIGAQRILEELHRLVSNSWSHVVFRSLTRGYQATVHIEQVLVVSRFGAQDEAGIEARYGSIGTVPAIQAAEADGTQSRTPTEQICTSSSLGSDSQGSSSAAKQCASSAKHQYKRRTMSPFNHPLITSTHQNGEKQTKHCTSKQIFAYI